MISQYFKVSCCLLLLINIFATQICCQNIENSEDIDEVISKEGEEVVPAWVKGQVRQANIESYAEEGVPPLATPTTARPSNPIQGIIQGIIRAPGNIANRVQGILDGILRRPSTAPPKPFPPIAPAAPALPPASPVDSAALPGTASRRPPYIPKSKTTEAEVIDENDI